MRQCQSHRLRRSGPGGQHRNKVETAVVFIHLPTGIQSEANERRSQSENLRTAFRRLRIKLALGIRSHEDLKTPSDLWRSRCKDGKISVSAKHDDFPALLAEVLDRLNEHEYEVRNVAEALGCSTSQLIKFLKIEPKAFSMVNNIREKNGISKLK